MDLGALTAQKLFRSIIIDRASFKMLYQMPHILLNKAHCLTSNKAIRISRHSPVRFWKEHISSATATQTRNPRVTNQIKVFKLEASAWGPG
jgi:hypothetical protein